MYCSLYYFFEFWYLFYCKCCLFSSLFPMLPMKILVPDVQGRTIFSFLTFFFLVIKDCSLNVYNNYLPCILQLSPQVVCFMNYECLILSTILIKVQQLGDWLMCCCMNQIQIGVVVIRSACTQYVHGCQGHRFFWLLWCR